MNARSDTAGNDAASPSGLLARLFGRRSAASHSDTRNVADLGSTGFVPGPPADVLRAAMRSLGGAGRPVAAYLWVAETGSGALRLLCSASATGNDSPSASATSPDLGPVLEDMRPVLTALSRVADSDGEAVLYRYALPLDTGTERGVAAVDMLSSHPADASVIERRVRTTVPSLTSALAIEMARVRTQAAHALLGMARDLSRLLSVDEVVEACLDRAMVLVGAATGSVMLLDSESERMTICASRGIPAGVAASTEVAAGEGIAGWVLTTGKSVLVEDLPAAPAKSRREVRSALSVPIADDDGILGVLNVGSREYPARFTEEHTSALEALAGQAAVAVRNARAVSTARDLYLASLEALTLALETKDPYASGATGRVVNLTSEIGLAMHLEENEAEALRVASILHDMCMEPPGRMGTGRGRILSTVEQGMLKMHPVLAAEIMAEAPALRAVVPIVYHHHEWYDGEGYVTGLSGEAIPIGARILSAADAYVAMTSARPHRPAMTREQAVRELEGKAGTQFDPAVVAVLAQVVRGGEERVPKEG